MRKFICLLIVLFISHAAVADYITISGSNDTNSSTQSIMRFRDDFIPIWERSPATGTPEPYVNDIEISPLDPNLGGGDVYTAHYGFDPPTGLSARHYSAETGAFIGQVVPSAAGDGQYDGTGTYIPQIEGRSAVLQDITFGYDYNGDGVQDLWAARRDWFEIYDGTTLNRTGEDGTADLLTFMNVPDSSVRDGSGAFGFCFGLDVTGDGVAELFAMRGINSATGSRLNVWNPVTLTEVASYNMDGVRDNTFMILGPDVNGDGAQDLWVAEARNHRLMAIDCATGIVLSDEITLVPESDPAEEFTIRYPQFISSGPDGTILISTRFASSLDADWEGGGDIQGGDLLQVVWDPDNQQGLVSLLYEYPGRLSGTTYIPIDKTRAHYQLPADNAVEIPRDVVLTWEASLSAATHNVYLSTDVNAVADGSADALVSQNQAEASYDPPGLLEWDATYYWRVDEIEADGTTIFAGDLWNFTTVNFIVVEDFEDYNDFPPDEVWNTWIDGFGDPTNGSTAGYPEPDFVAGEHYLDTTIFHGGKQSLPLFYNNSAGLSEITRALSDSLTDWTQDDVVTLTLWYYGDAANAAEPMYVALNGSAVVTNEDANAALATGWTRWDIPLEEFANQGLNLTNVSSISLGFGNKANPTAGGEGHVFFDDIRLYRP